MSRELDEQKALVSSQEWLDLLPPEPRLPDNLRRFVVPAPVDLNDLTVSSAARALEITEATMYDWIKAKRLIAFRVARNPFGVGIPSRQILGPQNVVPGIDQVLEIIPNPRLAWIFLTEDNYAIDPDRSVQPIDVLKAGDVDAVVKAAAGWGMDFT